MTSIIHRTLELFKITRVLNHFLSSIIDLSFFNILQQIMMEDPRLVRENLRKDVRNIFRFEKLKKETIDNTS